MKIKRYYHRIFILLLIVMIVGVLPVFGQTKTKEEQVKEAMATAKRLKRGGDINGALAKYRDAISLDPRGKLIPNIRMEIADIYLEKEDFLSAIEEYLTILKEKPSFTDARERLDKIYELFYERGTLLYKQRKYDEAIESFEIAVAAQPDNTKTRLELKDIYVERKNYDEAIKHLTVLVKYDPDNIDLRMQRAIYLSWRRRFDESIEEYRKIIELDPNNLEASTGLARVTSWKGLYEEAIAAYYNILRIDPSYNKARLGIASIKGWQGKYEESIQIYKSTLERDDLSEIDRLDALYQLAKVYSWDKKYDESIETYKSVFLINPRDPNAYAGIGRVNFWRGNHSEAIQNYQKALEIDPLHVEAHIGIATVYFNEVRIKESIKHYGRALELDPGNELAREGILRARSVKQSAVSLDCASCGTIYPDSQTYNNSVDLGFNYTYDKTFSMFYGLRLINLLISSEGKIEGLDIYSPILLLSGTYRMPTHTALTLGFSQGLNPSKIGFLQEYKVLLSQGWDVKALYNTFFDFFNDMVLDGSYLLSIYPIAADLSNLNYIHSLSSVLTYFIIPELNLQVRYLSLFALNDKDKTYWIGQYKDPREKPYFDLRGQSVSTKLTYDSLSWFSASGGANYGWGYDEEAAEGGKLKRTDYTNYSFPVSVAFNILDAYSLYGGYEIGFRISYNDPFHPEKYNTNEIHCFSFGISYNF